jgi:hypothetical protein
VEKMSSVTTRLKKVAELVGGIMFLGWTFILGLGGFFLLGGLGYSLCAGHDFPAFAGYCVLFSPLVLLGIWMFLLVATLLADRLAGKTLDLSLPTLASKETQTK